MHSDWLINARILLVDDEPANVELLERLLNHAGYANILGTSDSRMVTTLYEAFQPDIILLDWLMPYMDGQDVLRELQPLITPLNYVPVLVLTADVTRETRQRALASGAKDFLTKPLDAAEMDLRIRNLLETRFLHQQLFEQNESLQREITERRKVEEALRSSEERFRALFLGAPDMVFVIDQHGQIIDANPAIEAILGYSVSQIRGRPIELVIASLPREQQWGHSSPAQDERRSASYWLAEVFRHERSVSLEYVYRQDQSLCPVDVTANSILLGEQRVVLAVARDATVRLRAEAEIRKALAREQELGQLKNNFISMTSHEFRTPLSTILSSAELLEHYGMRWSEEKRIGHIQRIQQAVRHLTYLLDDVLFLGRADANKLNATPTEIDLVQFCQELVEELEFSLIQPGRVTIHANQPSIVLTSDIQLLRQILINLLTNAVKYSPATNAVRLELSDDQASTQFCVIDQGIGIPQEALAHLYEAFHRASNAEHVPGTGLGLAIVKRSLDALGGTIECQSHLDVGTTFCVRLPRWQ